MNIYSFLAFLIVCVDYLVISQGSTPPMNHPSLQTNALGATPTIAMTTRVTYAEKGFQKSLPLISTTLRCQIMTSPPRIHSLRFITIRRLGKSLRLSIHSFSMNQEGNVLLGSLSLNWFLNIGLIFREWGNPPKYQSVTSTLMGSKL